MPASDKYNERVEAILGRSPSAEALVAAGALATGVLAAAMPLPLEARAGCLAWIAASALGALRRLRPGTRLRVDCDGAIAVGSASGAISEGSFVAPRFAVIRWRPAGAWVDRTVLVARDMLGAEDFRRLRVILRWGK